MREEEVGHENGDVVAPASVDGGPSTAERGFVDDVVVKERGGVDKFNSGSDADSVRIGSRMLRLAGMVEGFCAEESEDGAEFFPRATADVGANVGNKGIVGLEDIVNLLINSGDVVLDVISEKVHALPSSRYFWGHYHQILAVVKIRDVAYLKTAIEMQRHRGGEILKEWTSS
jgi:hypothetical protein